MKQAYLWGALLALYLPAAGAVELNKDALKTMQEQGDKLIDEQQGSRPFKLSTGLCLHSSGKNGATLTANKCNTKSNNQKWRLDKQSRLVSYSGTCVGVTGASAIMQKCGNSKSQQWKHDGKKRLAGSGKKCLQADGDGKSSGTGVSAAACGNSTNQVWN